MTPLLQTHDYIAFIDSLNIYYWVSTLYQALRAVNETDEISALGEFIF